MQTGKDETGGRARQRDPFRCEYALAAAGVIVLGVALFDAFADRFELVGRSVIAAVGGSATAGRP
jgi:hypothetical protein